MYGHRRVNEFTCPLFRLISKFEWFRKASLAGSFLMKAAGDLFVGPRLVTNGSNSFG